MLRKLVECGRLGRRGTVAALVGISLPLLIGATAVGLDGGMMYVQRRQAQSAADSAALATAYALKNGASFSAAQTAGTTIGSENGITITSSQITQPTSSTVAVSVTSTQPRMFSAIWGSGSLSATATATASWGTTSSSATPYSTSAVVLLNTVNPSMSQSLYLTGSACLATNAGVQVNSSSTTAVWADNSGHSSSTINVVGSWYEPPYNNLLTGTIHTGVSVVSDPLASIATPSVPTTAGGYASIPGVSPTGVSPYPGWGNWAMTPGVFTSDPNPRGGSTITMQPGLYYFNGCNFTVNNGATVTGTGVTIYMAAGGSLSFQGGCPVTLSAPTSSSAVNGAIAGLVYFQARTSTTQVNFANGTNISLTGTFYAAKAQLAFAGGNLSQFASQVVCDNMNLSNDAQITIAYSSSTVAGSSAYSYPVALIK